MGRHQRAPYRVGHRRAELGILSRHCHYDPEPWPVWLMGETQELIDEVMEWEDDDDDGDHPVPAEIS